MHSARGCCGGMVQENGSQERCSSWTVLNAQCTSVLSSGFPLLHGNAEALDRWGGKTKHHLISYFLSNTSAKNYCNWIMYVKIIASQRWDVFWGTVYCNLCNSISHLVSAKWPTVTAPSYTISEILSLLQCVTNYDHEKSFLFNTTVEIKGHAYFQMYV